MLHTLERAADDPLPEFTSEQMTDSQLQLVLIIQGGCIGFLIGVFVEILIRERRDIRNRRREGRPMQDRKIAKLDELQVLKALSEMYLANPGSTGKQFPHPGEFVSCISPKRGSETHLLWRRAYALTHKK